MKKTVVLTLSLIGILFAGGAAQSAPPKPRPYSGCGVLALSRAPGDERLIVPLYYEPGIARFAELDGSALPRIAGNAPEPIVAVSSRKGGWTRLAYDDAGREAWVRPARAWEYHPWQEYLPGRVLRILPGMKNGYYALKGEPNEAGTDRGTLTREQTVRVVQVTDDWVRVQSPSGWFRWRDADGRLTVSLQEAAGVEKR